LLLGRCRNKRRVWNHNEVWGPRDLVKQDIYWSVFDINSFLVCFVVQMIPFSFSYSALFSGSLAIQPQKNSKSNSVVISNSLSILSHLSQQRLIYDSIFPKFELYREKRIKVSIKSATRIWKRFQVSSDELKLLVTTWFNCCICI
jgi:acid stress-induced BolA-like protein IbaG/YrbA